MTQDRHPEHPEITPEMWDKIDAIISANCAIAGSMIPVLRECQDIVGYLPVELLDYISLGLNLPRSEVFGVATFYSLFSMTPKGRHTIKLCLGTACYVKGVKDILSRLGSGLKLEDGKTTEDRRFSLKVVRCLGACGLAPAMVVDQDTHRGMRPDTVLGVLDQYK